MSMFAVRWKEQEIFEILSTNLCLVIVQRLTISEFKVISSHIDSFLEDVTSLFFYNTLYSQDNVKFPIHTLSCTMLIGYMWYDRTNTDESYIKRNIFIWNVIEKRNFRYQVQLSFEMDPISYIMYEVSYLIWILNCWDVTKYIKF